MSSDCYNILGQRVMVRCTSGEFAARVRRLLCSFPSLPEENRPPDVVFSLVVAPPSKHMTIRPFHFVYRDGSRAGRTTQQWQLFRFLECQLDILLAEKINNSLLVHAGGVSRNGSGIVMPGPSGSGKSSLTLALVQSGYRYYSDEIAVVDSDSGELHAFPKPLSIKNRSIFPGLAQQPDLWFGPESEGPEAVWYIHPEDMGREMARQPAPIQYLIFPSRGSHGEAELAPIAPGQALKELAANSINFTRLGNEGFHLIADLVNSAQCYSLKSDNLETSVALVNRLVDFGA